MRSISVISALALLSALSSLPAQANQTKLQEIQSNWAICQYNTPEKSEQKQCFQTLIQHTEKVLAHEPPTPALTVWLAINKASLAGVKGGLGALSLAKEAKALLEQVIETAPETLDGSAYTSLGSLYYKVPGWPIGFGDDGKAEQLLKQALAINPNGIDPNYFYGDFLLEEGRNQEAKMYFTKALNAAPRAERPLADQGRRQEINLKMAKLTD
ncbi:tetratricopeptide repeat protein [Agarivorans sp.]|uniref:tetratricopeptide repeat protein n=1 Tax=Agarivorans sp. TaxID=1872412 RepID=UPI003D041516